MSSDLPYAADAQTSISYDELEVLRLQYRKEQAQGEVSTQTKFNYAWGLVKSPKKEDQEEGVKLLREVYREDSTRRRECLYYLALGHYKMGNYEEARKFNAVLLEKEPGNLQGRSLQGIIDTAMKREGYIGMALVGGAAALGTLLIAGLVRKARK
ncbi:hypothetical protein M422DRAFT_219942 [Sphaerobolus stellatus SS14]|nr:hypothetical protein M422DRAFT_219942 [Sphaerobolus stellatus SS14]